MKALKRTVSIPGYQLDYLADPLLKKVADYFEDPEVKKKFKQWEINRKKKEGIKS